MKRVRVLHPFDGHEPGAIVVLDHGYARHVISRGIAEHPLDIPVETKTPEPAPADPLDHDGDGRKGGAKRAPAKKKAK